jgi:hypothetical protein
MGTLPSERAVMFHLFSRHPLPPAFMREAARQQLGAGATTVTDVSRPDFDPSDFDESPPTVPGGYWHRKDDSREDATKVS